MCAARCGAGQRQEVLDPRTSFDTYRQKKNHRKARVTKTWKSHAERLPDFCEGKVLLETCGSRFERFDLFVSERHTRCVPEPSQQTPRRTRRRMLYAPRHKG